MIRKFITLHKAHKIIEPLIKNQLTVPQYLWVMGHPIILTIMHSWEDELNQNILPFFKNKTGICIGGILRWRFQDYLSQAKCVKNVDITSNYREVDRETATTPEYVTEANNLYFAETGTYDFVCSSHVLEHIANPIKAIKEWQRVIKPQGIVYCAVPDKRFTFDRKRKRTPLSHIIQDYKRNLGLKDLTHILENPKKKNLPWINKYVEAEGKKIMNIRQPHHHVFVEEDVVQLFSHIGMNILFVALRGDTIHIVTNKRIITHDEKKESPESVIKLRRDVFKVRNEHTATVNKPIGSS